MMRTKTLAIGAFALIVMAGCKNQTTTTSTTATPTTTVSTTHVASPALTPEELGAIGAEIKRHPDDAHKILTDHGLDDASFEKAIRSVSSDPAASRRYAAAYKKKT